MSGAWMAVACAAHVRRGVAGGFMQVCHGKAAPLRRLRPGDRVAYYSPVETLEGRETLQAFTALATVLDGPVTQVEMAPGFRPFRLPVRWEAARPVPIRPLLDRLSPTAGRRHWGQAFRYGLLPATLADIDLIAAAMAAA